MIQPDPKKRVIIQSGNRFQPAGKVVASTSADVDYTPRNVEYNEKIKKSGFLGSQTEGIKVDNSGNTTVKPFSRRIVTNGRTTKIIGDNGTVIKEGPSDRRDIEEAVKQSQKHVDQTNSQRERNKRVNDLFGRKAENITENEVADLNQNKHATGNPKDPRIIKAEAEETARKNRTERDAGKSIKVRLTKK